MQGASLAHAAGGASTTVRPSDCRPRDADSTCATAVAGAGVPPEQHQPSLVLYDGPLAGVPASGYAYWGFDFLAEQTRTPSPVRPDQFINRSPDPVTITLRFTVPGRPSCGHDCLPGVEFEVDVGWFKVDPPYVRSGSSVSLTNVIRPGQGYGWVIGLWQASDPRLTVTVPQGSHATLQDVGLPATPNVADVIPAAFSTCDCMDGTTAACSDGARFSNGLLGPWSQNFQIYTRAGAFNNCAQQR